MAKPESCYSWYKMVDHQSSSCLAFPPKKKKWNKQINWKKKKQRKLFLSCRGNNSNGKSSEKKTENQCLGMTIQNTEQSFWTWGDTEVPTERLQVLHLWTCKSLGMPSQGLGERLGFQLSYTLSPWQAFRMPTESFLWNTSQRGSRSSVRVSGAVHFKSRPWRNLSSKSWSLGVGWRWQISKASLWRSFPQRVLKQQAQSLFPHGPMSPTLESFILPGSWAEPRAY